MWLMDGELSELLPLLSGALGLWRLPWLLQRGGVWQGRLGWEQGRSSWTGAHGDHGTAPLSKGSP